MAARCAGVLPQHAPMIVAPASRNSAAYDAMTDGSALYTARMSTSSGMPALDFATRMASGAAARILAMTGTSSSGPFPQLPPTASAPHARSDVVAY
jgi:hypothetical protein